MAREQELGELGGKRPGRPGVRPVGRIGLVAAVGGVRHGAARGDEQALEFVPLRRRVHAGADAPNLHALVDHRAIAEALDENAVGLSSREGRNAPAAFRTPVVPATAMRPMASPRGKASLTNRSTCACRKRLAPNWRIGNSVTN